MDRRTYEEYIKNNCHPTGYNEAVEHYIFSGVTVDLLLDKISELRTRIDCLRNGIIDDETLKILIKEHRMYKEVRKEVIDKVEQFFQERFATRASSNISATTIKRFLDQLRKE